MSGERAMTIQETVIHRITNNKTCEGPDLTTPDGAFWIMARLEGWDRFEEFCVWKADKEHPVSDLTALITGKIRNDIRAFFMRDILTWLGENPAALYKAIEEFMEVRG